MDYFVGLDISMDETHVCVLDREGVVVRESKTESTAQAIAGELSKGPSCRRIVFETGRMAPILFHGLSQLGLPVVCVESRQAYQALKSLATHKTDRNDARGLAHLARTGFFKPVHVKSLHAHALRSLIIARKKLVGQRVTLENQIRGLAIVFGIRLPRALAAAFVNQALKTGERIAGLSAAMRGLVAARTAVMTAVAAIDTDMRRMTRGSAACRRLMTIPGVGQLTALAFVAAIDDPSRIRRSRDVGAYLGLVPRRYQSGELDYTGGISKCGDGRVRTLLYEAANVMLTRYKGQLKLKDWAFAIAKRSTMRKRESLWRAASLSSCMRCCETERSSHRPKPTKQEAETSSQEERRPREGADDGEHCVAEASRWPTAISTEPRCTQLTPSSAKRARRERRHPKAATPKELPPLMMWTAPRWEHLVPKDGRLSATKREAVHAEIYPNWRRHRQEFLSSPLAGERRLFRHET
jgi:transposase